MKVCLVALGIALLCTGSAVVYDAERCPPEKLLGGWYLLAFASNCSWMMSHLEDMEMVLATFSITEEGTFRISTNVPTPFGCQNVEIDFERREDGALVGSSAWGEQTVDLARSDCKSYMISVIRNELDGSSTMAVTLYGRTPYMTPETEQMFMKLAKELGMSDEQIQKMAPERDETRSEEPLRHRH
ncbi:epididymal-specific lipocalin-6 [Varanus komodoensis]|uniref:epididymal-specific lipocalin-6 n=1 Tax=Varanus komodoensis TaxID=61221 RepID=UPI001CF7A9E0|nr:epididymal-specific lipocalin-6 [Varanus komodoensis]